MNAFRRTTTSEDPIPEDLKPYYQGRNTAWQRWLGPILRGLLLIVLIGLLVWGGIWGVNKLIHHNDNKSTASTSTGQKSPNPKPENKGSNASKNPSPNPSSSGSTTPPPPATPSPNQSSPAPTPSPASGQGNNPSPTPTPSSTSGSQLANTGPGEVIAAFFGTVVLATLGFYFASAYRITASKE
jgi:predicted lipid-binding transport protein (Tim44 family)